MDAGETKESKGSDAPKGADASKESGEAKRANRAQSEEGERTSTIARHEAIIKKIYYDVETGFGSIAKTLKKAQEVLASITYGEVKTFLAKQEHKQTKKRRKDNSYVAFGPREQFQVDLADFGLTGPYRYALLAIDIFTKKLVVVPVKGKTSVETAAAFEDVLKILDVPNYVYSDEGGEFAGAFETKLKDNLIKHVLTRSSAAFVERAIRTLRDGISVRLTSLGLKKSNWYKMLPFVVGQYNDTEHTTTKVTPNDAAKLEWETDREAILEIRGAIADRAHHDVKYPAIAVGDRVKILRKPGKYGDFKSHFVAWTEETFKVEEISYDSGNPVFKLEGRSRTLRLHEMLKVAGVEKAPKLKVVGKQGATAQLKRKVQTTVAEPPVVPEPIAAVVGGQAVLPGRPRMRTKTKDPMDPRFEEMGLRANVSNPVVHPLAEQIVI
jgi:hypothetical protein